MSRVAVGVIAIVGALLWSTQARAQSVIHEIPGDGPGGSFGRAVAGVGDLDGDAAPDLAVGTTANFVRLYSGSTASEIITLNGEDFGDLFGATVDGLGDLNGDDVSEIMVGALADDNNGGGSGSVTVLSGFDFGVLYQFNGDAAQDNLGASVALAGDIDGDQIPDMIAGASQADFFTPGAGYARVYSGATGSTLFTFPGAAAGDRFAIVSNAGDVNSDGRDDMIVGAPQSQNGTVGYARVFSGLDGSVLHNVIGSAAGDYFGASVSGVGDVNNDGHDDFIVGAPQISTGQPGYARVFSGLDGAVLYELCGDDSNDRFGGSVSEAGDLDGDGTPDFVVGAPTPSPILASRKDTGGGTFGPFVRAFSGATGAVLFTKLSTNEYGYSVDAAGDVNNDGVRDIVAGAPHPPGAPSLPFVQVITLACTDADGDGYGAPGLATCPAGPETDCDDADPDVNPGAAEIPGNGKDDDCNPATPGGCAPAETVAGGAAWGAIGYVAVAGLLAALGWRRNNLSLGGLFTKWAKGAAV